MGNNSDVDRMKMMRLDRIEYILTRILEGIIVLCFIVIFVLIIALVILRYGFNTTIIGGNEFVVMLFIYTSALGAAVIVGKREHIAITWFIDKLPSAPRKVVDIINFLSIAFINAVMIVFSIHWINTTGDYLTAVLRIPQLYAQIIVPVGCGVAVLYCLYQILLILSPRET
ncbi:MAG: TRAP transporter small permease [Fidelibacterota bacterium]|nr:MAG: TRAP transporter small permease [Candidatus Neomarinimicrobiota bacterium]